jgi:hypothetical protein
MRSETYGGRFVDIEQEERDIHFRPLSNVSKYSNWEGFDLLLGRFQDRKSTEQETSKRSRIELDYRIPTWGPQVSHS